MPLHKRFALEYGLSVTLRHPQLMKARTNVRADQKAAVIPQQRAGQASAMICSKVAYSAE